MFINSFINIIPVRIRRYLSMLLSIRFFNRLCYKINGLESSLLKIIHGDREFYQFKFFDYILVGNIRFIHGTKDLKIYELIRAILKNVQFDKDSLFIDIGSNIGLTSIIIAEFAKKKGAKIHAFEPGEQIKYLTQNIKLSNNENIILPREMALYNKNTELTLYTYKDSIVDSRLFIDNEWKEINKKNIHKKSVKACTYDDYLKDNQINHKNVKLIKIDCQGSEPYIFEKMYDAFKPGDELNVIFEYWPYAMLKQKISPDNFLLSVYEKFNGFNFYYFHNESELKMLKSKYDLKLLTDQIGDGPNQFCDILITKAAIVDLQNVM